MSDPSGTMASAVTCVCAIGHRADILGMLILATVPEVAGGTTRDAFVNQATIVFVKELYASSFAGMVVFYLVLICMWRQSLALYLLLDYCWQ